VFLQFAGCGDTGPGAVEADLAGTSGISGTGKAGQESGGVVSVSVGTGKRKEEEYKIAAKEYEKLGLLDYSMDEEGSKSAGEEDESLLNVEDGQEMDVDNTGAAPGGGSRKV